MYVLSVNGNFKALHQKNIVGTTFTWPALPPGPYLYWVRVTGDTAWSSQVDIDTSGRTSVLAPVGSTNDRTPTISWRPVDGAVRYELWVDLLGADEKIIYQTNLTAANYTPASNLPTGNYRVWVRAVGSSLTAPWSEPADFTIADAVNPNSRPKDLELLASVFSDSLLPLLDERPSMPTSAVKAGITDPIAESDQPQEVKVVNAISVVAGTRPYDVRSRIEIPVSIG